MILAPNSFKTGISLVNALKVPCGEYCLMLASFITAFSDISPLMGVMLATACGVSVYSLQACKNKKEKSVKGINFFIIVFWFNLFCINIKYFKQIEDYCIFF